ncbi:MAG: ACT domain-containing protein [Verrucomicrobia bacterium]|nr:ACT domain-containing protein [Verrucomicrobiota bacterium]
MKVEGNDAPGIGSRIAAAVADAGVNLRGVSGAVIGQKFVAYLGFDEKADADKAARVLKALGTTRKSKKRKGLK